MKLNRVLVALVLMMPMLCGMTFADESASSSSSSSEAHVPKTVDVVLHTALGDIVMQIEVERAPITAKNFLRYVDEKRLDGMVFYRALKMDDAGQYALIQGGLHFSPEKLLKPIKHEPTNVTGLSHTNGAVSMARLAPGTATAEFFIVIGDITTFDAAPGGDGDAALGYAAFGHVVEGMDVVKKILEQPRSDSGDPMMAGQMIKKPVKVSTARRATQSSSSQSSVLSSTP